MIPFSLQEVLSVTGGLYVGNGPVPDASVTDIVIDSRKVTPGALYVPVRGDVYDGHSFIPSARENGAVCVLSSRVLEEKPYILVPDTVEALQLLAKAYRERFAIPFIGVTGSAGKTSTKDMLSVVLGSAYSVFKTPGNLNNQTGVPQALFQIEADHELAILEMGTNHPGEIRKLSAMVQPTVCVLTNIGVAHIEFFGSRENIFKGKAEMMEHMREGGTVVVNGDDDMLRRLDGAVTFGFRTDNDVFAEDVEDLGLSGSRFTVCLEGRRYPAKLNAPGRHMITNALCAIAVGRVLGIDAEKLCRAVSGYAPAAGRMLIQSTGKFTVLDDTYNANPTSVMAAIDVLEKAEGRRVCILGDMLELGERSEELHESIGAYAAVHGIEQIICVGAMSEYAYQAAEKVRGEGIFYFSTQRELLLSLPSLLCDGDTVLVKGSRGMHMEDTVSFLKTL